MNLPAEVSVINIFLLICLLALATAFFHQKRKTTVAAKRHLQELVEANSKVSGYVLALELQSEKISQSTQLLQSKNMALERAQAQTDQLLLNVLPKSIADRIKSGDTNIADSFDEVTVLFADLVNFTSLASRLSAAQLVDLLNRVFSLFDIFSEQYAVEKIKTIGDAYMIVSGAPEPRADHTEAVADMALEIQQTIALLTDTLAISVQVRIGIQTGAAVAGVIGKKKFSYDMWGETVNTASRLESHGEAGKIHVSEAVYEKLKDAYLFEPRGLIELKGQGSMQTYFLVGKRIQQNTGQFAVATDAGK